MDNITHKPVMAVQSTGQPRKAQSQDRLQLMLQRNLQRRKIQQQEREKEQE